MSFLQTTHNDFFYSFTTQGAAADPGPPARHSGANKSGVRKYGPVQQYDQKWKTGIRCAAEVTANVSAGVHGSATVSKSGETFVKKYVTGEKYL